MWGLKFRMWLLMGVMFAIIYAIVSMVSYSLGVSNFYFYLILSFVFMFIQYMVGPKIVEWSMRVKYIREGEYPEIRKAVQELAATAKIPVPRIGIAQVAIPNAFAFGRSIRDGRVCVTEGILKLLNHDELKAVLGHELSHLKNRDVLTITVLSVIPMIMFRIAFHFLFFGGRRSRSSSGGNTILIGLAAFIFYFITNLLVLYASRVREYFADKGSVDLGNAPSDLASALYKLVYGSARMPKEAIKDVEGMKAFFANDPSRAVKELTELKDLDLDRSGTISADELRAMQSRELHLGFGDRMMELLSTHPNMLKRIKRLSEWKA